MKPVTTSLAVLAIAALLSAQAQAQPSGQQKSRGNAPALPRSSAPPAHAQRHRDTPPVTRDRTPPTYRTGVRPPNLEQRRREADPKTYRHNYQSAQRYRWNTYVRPQGWYSHRWIYGDILPTLFWTRTYWISDFWLFNLRIPPLGYVWVRYGDDALLVNTTTGEILQVVYSVYY
ncbi:RcnB family protein [Sphingopyxis sp.]|uniref:RcnB family protein n=1 Tax=Sphingopyxis sp. TaxID=1908224 RepID=UPI001DC7CA5D|nr:RcnB family protein [Sphingopyxis sp.]MBW8294481.1 RcnB family protein [Sphingopyxis sp.]